MLLADIDRYDPIPLVARKIWWRQLAIIRSYDEAVREHGEEMGVHETRKAIRRTRTAFKLFRPYFRGKVLKPVLRQLRKTMRGLAPARDMVVFIRNLEQYLADRLLVDPVSNGEAFLVYWLERRRAAEGKAQKAVANRGYQQTLARYEAILLMPGDNEKPRPDNEPFLVSQLAPIFIYQRLAYVRMYESGLEEASLTTLHELRVQFKELRYSLEFFAPVLEGTQALLLYLNTIQDCLGDLNDATVALRYLDKARDVVRPSLLPALESYRQFQEGEIQRLRSQFSGHWAEFNGSSWQMQLAAAVGSISDEQSR